MSANHEMQRIASDLHTMREIHPREQTHRSQHSVKGSKAMRFEDTLEGWTEQMNQMISNNHLARYLRAISPLDPILVENSKEGADAKEVAYKCHWNVKQRVETNGGAPVFGWIVKPSRLDDDDRADGLVMSVFHCNWLAPDGKLLNITPFEGKFHIFLQDNVRKYDFNTNTSYNMRIIHLDSFVPPKGMTSLAHNVTYFCADRHISREKIFEKFKKPDNLDEAFAAVPASMRCTFNGELDFTEEGKQWLALKYNVFQR